MTNVMKV